MQKIAIQIIINSILKMNYASINFGRNIKKGTQFCAVITRKAETILHDAEWNGVQTRIYR